MRCGLLVALLFLTAGRPVVAQDLGSFEKILLPVVTKGVIAGVGADFSTAVWAQSFVKCPILGARFFSSSSGTSVYGDGTLDVDVPGSSRAYGRFIYLDRACADQVSLSLMVGFTAIPVVRERDWRSGRTEFLGAWFNFFDFTIPAQRLRLRIFDHDGNGTGEVAVRSYLVPHEIGAGDTRIRLDRRDGTDQGSPFYAEIEIPTQCIRITRNQPDCIRWPIRVEIDPQTPGLRYWALFTSTSNDARQTIFAPLPQP